MTYLEINQVINIIALQLCNDLRLKDQMKNQKLKTKHEVGLSWEQFGIDKIKIKRITKEEMKNLIDHLEERKIIEKYHKRK